VGCATSNNPETPLIDMPGLASGEYVQEAKVRLVLNEPGSPDPWSEVPPGATTPADTNVPPEPNGQGICAPLNSVVRCNLRMPVTVTRNDGGLPGLPGAPTVDTTCVKSPSAPGCPLFIPRP
jgi:hypothetical protein